MKILMANAKKRLAILWFVAFILIFILLLMQTIRGVYQDHTTEAWSWFLPTIIPTLSLMIAVFVSDALGISQDVKYVDRFFYRLTFFLSLFYLLIIGATIIAQVFSEKWPWELLQQSSLWLGPIQGLVAGSLVIFFRQKESQSTY
jgi:hypothetical protein